MYVTCFGFILNYSSEIWGFTKSKDIERVHLKFCKRILNVRVSTCSAGEYGEFARYPLFISRYCKIIKYWCKLVDTDNIILSKLYDWGLSHCHLGHANCVSNVKALLDRYGFSHVFIDPHSVLLKSFPFIFKQRVIDVYVQEWYGTVERSSALTEYKCFKNCFSYERYLDYLPYELRCVFTKFRIAGHSLRVQTGRYGRNQIPRNERYCLYCGSIDIEDIYHFICICPCYNILRKQFIDPHYYKRPSVYKFNSLMSSDNNTTLHNLAKFIKLSLVIRNNINV